MKIQWPTHPKHGDRFCYLCPISGADYVEWVFINNDWYRLGSEETQTLLKLFDLPSNWRNRQYNIFE